MKNNQVWIFDTTLRDGEQSPGASMNVEEKVVIARQLEKLGVNVIEAGFAASSPGDFESVKRVAETVSAPIVLSLARTREADIQQAVNAVVKAQRPGIHIFIATSDLHLQRKLVMSRQEAIDAACWAIEYARKYVDYVEFSAEDASRSDPAFLVKIFGEVIRCGASTLNVPDTTGYATPDEFGALFAQLIKETPGGEGVRWSAHCHNDLGMAVANSLSAVRNGARQIECTINGIGERAGNTSMEEVVMALETRRDVFGLQTNIVTEQIYPASRLLSQVTGLVVPLNKPIVGANAFAHEAGIHQDGVLKDKQTYEIMRPETVGISGNRLVLGKHSGRRAFVDRLHELGIDSITLDVNSLFARFKELADRKKNVYDEDILALVASETRQTHSSKFILGDVQTNSCSKRSKYTARVELIVNGESRNSSATGDGMIDAVFQALRTVSGLDMELLGYSSSAVTGGTDAVAETTCRLAYCGREVPGRGIHTDSVHAAALACVNALNRLV